MATVIIYLVVEQLFLHRIPQVDIFVEEEMLLEEEHVVAGLAGQAAPAVRYLSHLDMTSATFSSASRLRSCWPSTWDTHRDI